MSPPPLYVAVVDDDPSLCRSLSRLLRAAGMHAISYASAEDFLADSKQPAFDCLVLDVQLGGMSGIDLGHWLTAEGGSSPIIFMTAFDDNETRSRAERAGGAAYFRKTDGGSGVLEAIRRLTA
ncbi:response regulator [Ramlibacter sp. PS3R-8]|uniref:response regulator transcription factor n=1 Tax=Ramlibacter sp. PS3R-8 TaxID=3133437 RepID=UPI0030B691CD